MDEKDKSLPEVYANSITVSNTFFDFSLIFKKETITQSDEGQEKQTEDVSFVRISPQLAKALLQLLQENVAQYEQVFGEIPDFKNEGK